MKRGTGLNAIIPPSHSAEAEQSVIGGIMLDNTALDRVADVITEDDFYASRHQVIYGHAYQLLASGKAVDVVTLGNALKNSGKFDQVGGIEYLGALVENVPTAANIRRYAEIVREKATLRRLAAVGAEIADDAMNPAGRTAAEVLDGAQGKVLAIAEAGSGAEPQQLGMHLPAYIELLDQRFNSDGELTGLPTGVGRLDRKLNGLQPGDLIIVAARPSMGKSGLALQIALTNARARRPVLFFSLEMSVGQLAERALSNVGGIDSESLRSGKITNDEWDKTTAGVGQLHDIPLIIDDVADMTVGRMRARARRTKRKHGLSLIVIDYLQLVSGSGDNRNEQISGISRGLKLLAREMNVPVVALSQLSRKVEERNDKRPQLADLRDSGAIEQDADVVVLMYRDEAYNPDSDAKGVTELNVAKQRMGPIGIVPAAFVPALSRFGDLDGEWHHVRSEPKRPRRGFKSDAFSV